MDANLIDIQKSVNDFLQALDEYAVGVFFMQGMVCKSTVKILSFLLI